LKLGIEKLIENPKVIQGKRVGLLTNPTGINQQFQSTVDLIKQIEGVQLTALYSLEHGFRGDKQAGEKVETYIDDKTNVPVYSLYGQTERPTAETVQEIDAFIYDIQDVGVRFYTYISSLAYAMEAAKEHNKEIVVLDRPNPITGMVEGPVLQKEYTSFVGAYPIVTRYGLTPGELAHYYNDHFGIGCQLTVVKMEGWNPNIWYDQTHLPWVAPSPNLPTIESVILYPGTCLLEGTNLSEGRGTTKPFEIFGAAWMDGETVARELNAKSIDGVVFRATYFTPVFSKFASQLVSGVQLHITNRDVLRSVELGITIISTIKELYPEHFEWIIDDNNKYVIDRLHGSDSLRLALENGTLDEQLAVWKKEADDFRESINPYKLY
jgi:uncharacterized protein YbbC (DUF1343 family)